MRRFTPPPDRTQNDYDPLNPKSSCYTSGQTAGPPEDAAEDLPEFIPAEDPLPARERFAAPRRTQRRPARKKKRPLRTPLWTLVSFAVVFLLLNQFVFRIRHVRVIGSRTHDPKEIVRMAGLDRDVSFFALKRSDVETALSQDRYLQVAGFEKIFPSTLKLTVRERGLCANVQFNSVWYMTDEEGMILERLGTAEPRNNLLNVTGMQIRDARIGSRLITSREEQLNAYSLIMKELLSQGYVNEISEIYVGDFRNVLLHTRTGYMVRIGSPEENLMAKIAVTRAVAAKLQERGKEGGSIDMTDVSQPIYSP